MEEQLKKIADALMLALDGISQIQSMAQQEQGGQEQVEIQEEKPKEGDMPVDENPEINRAQKEMDGMVEKADESPSVSQGKDEGTTADDSSDMRLEETLPDDTKAALDEVQKGISKLEGAVFKKTEKTENSVIGLSNQVKKIVDVMKNGFDSIQKSFSAINNRMGEQEEGMENLMDAIGITEAIQKSISEKKGPVLENPNEYDLSIQSLNKIKKDANSEGKKSQDKRKSARDYSKEAAAVMINNREATFSNKV